MSVLSHWDILRAARSIQKDKKGVYHALYGSLYGGIVTDPCFMAVPFDDHMIHRGHAIFDTATLFKRKIYRLEVHLSRFLRSASLAKLKCPWTFEELKSIIMATCAAARVDSAAVRYWLSAGPGNFDIGPGKCTPSLWVLVFDSPRPRLGAAVDEVTVPVDLAPMKPLKLAKMKSTNYMLNVLLHLEAVDRGGNLGVWIDNKTVGELSVASLGAWADGVLRIPNGDVLDSCTIARIVSLFGIEKKNDPLRSFLKTADEDVSRMREILEHLDLFITECYQSKLSEEDLYTAGSLFYCLLDINIIPIRSLNKREIRTDTLIPEKLRELFELEALNTPHFTTQLPERPLPTRSRWRL